ncbi:MAG: serine hydrolase domain-containing protein [Candidatus Thorarchaeota archaeon]|jgi:CubicO group peptidase (beta-lactamase class C family)
MMFRAVPKIVVAILVVSTLFLAIPSDAQSTRPVQVWPTEGWATSTPEEQGMDATALAGVYDIVRDSSASIRSMLVVRHGYLVAEEYFTPQVYDINNTHIVYSVTKSVVSSLIGIAIDMGFIDNTSQLLLDFFPDRTIANMSAWKDAITLEDVLHMRTGFQWDEDNYDEYNDFFAMTDSDDWAQYVLDRPMAYEPGSTFYYNSGNSHLLATIINVTTGMTPLAFADQYLFGPIGITNRLWLPDPQGVNFGGSNLALRPQDMAKFGLLFLNNGTWDTQQVVSSDWVNRSSHGPATPYGGTSYGYQWWLNDYQNWYSARGYNGQLIYVIPEHDVVVVFSSDNTGGWSYNSWVGQVINAITNIYPGPTDLPPSIPYILVGGVALAGIAVVAIVVRLRT